MSIAASHGHAPNLSTTPMAAQTQVERANTRLFKKFASEICAENVTTEKYNLNLNKVADWLGSNIAAFYPAARPQVRVLAFFTHHPTQERV